MVGVFSIRSSTSPHRSRNVRLDASRAPFRFQRGSRAFARTLRVGRRPTDFVALLCVIKINLLEDGFYGGRRVREEGSRCHFERLLYIEEYFVNAHRTSVASRYLREGRVFPRGDLTFFCAKPCVLRKPVRSRPRDFFPSSPLSLGDSPSISFANLLLHLDLSISQPKQIADIKDFLLKARRKDAKSVKNQENRFRHKV